jgi:hypothetical protein
MHTSTFTGRHMLVIAALSLSMIACTLIPWLGQAAMRNEIQLTNEAVVAKNWAFETAIWATETAWVAGATTSNLARTPVPHSACQTHDLRLHITDGQDPVDATVRLYWPDTGATVVEGPVSEYAQPISTAGAAISVTVTAPGFLAWSRLLTPTGSLDVAVRLEKEKAE